MKIDIDRLMFGADPEIFTKDANNLFVAPTRLIEPSKTVVKYGSFGGVNRDGMAIELNPEPSRFPATVKAHMSMLLEELSRRLDAVGLKLAPEIGLHLDKEADVKVAPNDVFIIGCTPDYNAFDEAMNKMDVTVSMSRWRFTGGHIHVACGISLFKDACRFIRLVDTRCRKLMEYNDMEQLRRKHYGGFGSFRFKHEQGIVEYRSPSSSWLWGGSTFNDFCNEIKEAAAEFNDGRDEA